MNPYEKIYLYQQSNLKGQQKGKMSPNDIRIELKFSPMKF